MKESLLFKDKKTWQPTSKATCDRMVGYFKASLNGTGLTGSTIQHYEDFVRERDYANSTARLGLFAVQEHIRDLGMTDHPLLKYRIPNLLNPPQPTLTIEQKRALLRECDTSKRFGARDAAIIELFWVCGPRVSELPEILLLYLDLEGRWVTFECKATRGKGRKWRTARIDPRTVKAIERWHKFRKNIASPECKTIFCSQSGETLTPDGVACIIKRLSKNVGFHVSPHDFRRGGASYMVECGVPDRIVMEQFGWKDYKTFQRYTRKVKLNALDVLIWGDGDE